MKKKKKSKKEKIYRVPECRCGSYYCKECNPRVKKETQEPLQLLGESKNILNNHVKFCLVKHCSVEDYCTACLRCKDLYDRIDKYLKGQK